VSDTEIQQSETHKTALAAPRARFENVLTTIIERGKAQLARHIDPSVLTRVVMTEATRNPQIMECSPASIGLAVSLCGQLGLLPTGPLGQAYLIPRRNKGAMELTVIIGYKGLAELVRRSGEVERMDARVVYEGDEFVAEFGPDAKLVHKPTGTSRDPKDITHAYAWVKTKDGGLYVEILTRADIESRRKRGASGRGSTTPWDSDYAAMARKSALRALFTGGLVPMSVEVGEALAREDEDERLVLDGDAVQEKATPRKRSLGLTARQEPTVIDVPAEESVAEAVASADEEAL